MLFNPHIQSGLIETPSPAAESDAPRAGVVLVVGKAGSGPTTPVEFESAEQAYQVYGTKGELAREIELAILGAEYGAQVAGSRATPRVVGLRVPTGTPASATFYADVNKTEAVMRVETLEASDNTKYTFQFSQNDLTVIAPDGKRTQIFIERGGTPSTGKVTSPLTLVKTLRQLFADKLAIELFTAKARWELALDDALTSGNEPKIISYDGETVIRLDRFTTVDMDTLKSGATTYIGGEVPYDFSAAGAKAIHNRAIPDELNRNARFYALTAGRLVEVPRDVKDIRIAGLADAKRVGGGAMNSLLNVRTTGIGAAAAVTLEEAGSNGVTKVSEGYFRVRNYFVGNFSRTNEAVYYVRSDASSDMISEEEYLALPETDPGNGDPWQGLYTETVAYKIVFQAPQGVADEGERLSAAFAAALGAPYTADMVSTDRLGEKFSYEHPNLKDGATRSFLRLDMQEVRPGSVPEAIAIDLDGQVRASGSDRWVRTATYWKDGVMTLFLNKADFDAYDSTQRFDDAYVYVSYDSCVFQLTERSSTSQLVDGSNYEYVVAGDTVTFNKVLPHALAVRGLRVTQYRLGSDIEVVRNAAGNELRIYGAQKQPGEGGGPIGKMEVIFGADYEYEPEFPAATSTTLLGGSSGANADVATYIEAVRQALADHKDQEFKILTVAGLYVDSTVQGYDPLTGVPVEQNAGLIDVIQQHLTRVSQNGAAGVAFVSVKPLLPTTQTGRYTEEQLRRRFRELTQPDIYDQLRPATIINGKSLPMFFLFDAPMAVSIAGQATIVDGTAFFAGLRSAITNESALYQIQMPGQISPLYRYSAADIHMPSELARARFNVWSDQRGEVRLADERTAAGFVLDAKGRQVPSGFQSGVALHCANDFLQAVVRQLRPLLGALPTTGVDTLRGAVHTILQTTAGATKGVRGLRNFDPDRDIRINALGGNALGMQISIILEIAGELRRITIEVGATSEASVLGSEANLGGIPVAS